MRSVSPGLGGEGKSDDRYCNAPLSTVLSPKAKKFENDRGWLPPKPDTVPVKDESSLSVPTWPAAKLMFAAEEPLNSIKPPLSVPVSAPTVPSIASTLPWPLVASVRLVPTVLPVMSRVVFRLASSVPWPLTLTPAMLLKPVLASVCTRSPAPT